MAIELVISGVALFITIIVNIVLIAFFSGQLKSNQEHQKEMIELLRSEFKENFSRLEGKQDKHNGVIERTYCNEKEIAILKEQQEVTNHRLKDLEGVH